MFVIALSLLSPLVLLNVHLRHSCPDRERRGRATSSQGGQKQRLKTGAFACSAYSNRNNEITFAVL